MKPRAFNLSLTPIGEVRRGIVALQRSWAKGLRGIEGFSHIMVLYWLHQARESELFVHPRGDKRLPKVGFLAARTPHRPNPIGLTVVKLLHHRGRRHWVQGPDARDGAPILDIKPYTRRDAIRCYRILGWVRVLDKLETDPSRQYKLDKTSEKIQCHQTQS